MKKFLKKIGRFFIVLSQKDEKDIRQSILLVDGRFILPNNFALIIKDAREKFKNANLAVLAFKDKEEFIRDNFPGVEIIVPKNRIKPKRYRLAIQLLLLLRRNFKFIILSSFDISPVLISLMFFRRPILLHNKWLEWYILRQRTVSDIFHGLKSADRNRRRINKGIKDLIKSFGRILVILTEVREEDVKSRILIQDNGYTETGYILIAIRKIKEIFINPDITLLTIVERKQNFIDSFPQIKLVVAGENKNGNSLAVQMYRMRKDKKDKFDYVVLTALDIIPILVSSLFFGAEVLLYNRWHQWWSLKFKNLKEYIDDSIKLLSALPVAIFLLIVSGFILLRTSIRLQFIKLKIFSTNNKC